MQRWLEGGSSSIFSPCHQRFINRRGHLAIFWAQAGSSTTIKCCSQFDLHKDIKSLFSNLKFSAKLFYIWGILKPRTSVKQAKYSILLIGLHVIVLAHVINGLRSLDRVRCIGWNHSECIVIEVYRGVRQHAKMAIFIVKLYWLSVALTAYISLIITFW